MSSNTAPNNTTGNLAGLTPSECLRLLIDNQSKWLLPTIVCSVLALGYALVMSRYWEATQGLVVRREISTATGNEPGKFADLYEMRTFQETILELAKSQQVITLTLQAVEQAETGQPAKVPSASKIESFRKRLSLLPPGGAEFGKTEVCYLQVKDKNRDRAIRLVAELGQQIDTRLRRLRKEQSNSLSDELKLQVDRAQAALQIETARLAKFETEVGADLGELRMLNASFSGQSDLRQQAINLNNERRNTEMQLRKSEQLLTVLRDARQEPEQLIAMPNSLLESQPTLRRLKDGLVDAQLRAARLEGTRTADHPQVQAANDSVEHIRNDLHGELEVAIRGVQVELQLANNTMAKLEQQHQGVQQRLGRLAGLRADYANRTSAVENSRKVLDQAQKQLGEVSATQVAAHSASLVTPIDQPETGPYPAGPGRASIVLLGTFGGFAVGMGWLFLTVVPTPVQNPVPTPLQDSATTPVREENQVSAVVEPFVEPIAAEPAPAAEVKADPVEMPTLRNIPSSLPPAVATKIAEIVAARETVGSPEARV